MRRTLHPSAGHLLSLLLLLLASGCGGNSGAITPPPPTRTYEMSAAAVQALPGGTPFFQQTPPGFAFADLAADVDVITVVLEDYGIPWDEFAASATPPPTHPWTIAMQAFAAAAHATGRPVVVQAVLSRDRLVGRAVVTNGQLDVQSNWQPTCYDFGTDPNGPAYALAFQRFAVWIAQQFQPQHFVLGVEINAFYTACGGGAAWQSLINVANQSYAAVKAALPSAKVYPSFILNDLYASSLAGFDSAAVSALSTLQRDRLGLSSYPQGLKNSAGQPISAADLPADYFSRLRDRNPAEPAIVITETGWNSDDLSGGTPGACSVLAPSTEQRAADYLNFVLLRAAADHIDLVTWWSDRDLLPQLVMATCYPVASPPAYPECGTDPWCPPVNIFRAANPADPLAGEFLFKAFGTIGLRHYDATSKSSLLQPWQTALATPLAPHSAAGR